MVDLKLIRIPNKKERELRLYYSPNSCALASHIILEEVGADYSLELVDFYEK